MAVVRRTMQNSLARMRRRRRRRRSPPTTATEITIQKSTTRGQGDWKAEEWFALGLMSLHPKSSDPESE
jgi:hypothetical protein